MTQYLFSSNLDDLIDYKSISCQSLVLKSALPEQDVFETVKGAFTRSYTGEKLVIDENGESISFDADVARIRLEKNYDHESQYPYFLKFDLDHKNPYEKPIPGGLTEEIKKELYFLLLEKFKTGIKLPMAAISLEITNAGHGKENYGYSKMKNMLRDMSEFMSLEDTVTNGVPAILITLHPFKKYALEKEEKGNFPNTQSRPESLRENVALPYKTQVIFNKLLTGNEEAPATDVMSKLYSNYEEAMGKNQIFSYGKDCYKFDTGFQTCDGSKIEASIKLSEFNGKLSWVVNWFGIHVEAPKNALEKFADLDNWQIFLKDLASKALPERWTFRKDKDDDYSILRMYIKYTFYRLQLEDKICINEDQTFAAFNTGLVDYAYEDIYACFIPNLESKSSKWKFQCFCRKAERGEGKSQGFGKKLVESFKVLPQPASYFSTKDDLLMDMESELYLDYTHIVCDNLDRLPVSFVEEEARGITKALELVGKIRNSKDDFERRITYDDLKLFISYDPEGHKMYKRLKNRIDDAKDLAQKKVRWNFKTALPCYYPTTNVMSLMLPLSLVNDDEADVALVIKKSDSGSYLGHTILRLQDAYIDSRLICRPNSEWLNTFSMLKGENEVE